MVLILFRFFIGIYQEMRHAFCLDVDKIISHTNKYMVKVPVIAKKRTIKCPNLGENTISIKH